MKKIPFLFTAFFVPLVACAQGNPGPYIDKDIFNICAAIVVMALLLGFLLTFSRLFLDYRIKTRLSDSGLPTEVISTLLPEDKNSSKTAALKWAVILAGIGLACTLIYFTLPLGIHSLAILACCLSASFAVYYIILLKMKK
ncbi:hypothetical protein SAMN05444266_103135 [Chitinophaga jiangningensis]|uniref:SdpI/YhfL protein family protein n=1 Tax=Chitinophaga jiangningensis TaxID=1419482 RepID=A0A1M7A5F1_9BACT|nr:hypothetical protein [Chitinophaga jiangningensis]SHL37962.1 hypothetical protein SAMN05444266_103135 [Chitinophaga jiangningensis]